jgi:hypothetical protein
MVLARCAGVGRRIPSIKIASYREEPPLAEDEKTEGEAAARKQFLVHIDAALIRRVKKLAIDREVTASSLVQEAIADFLSRSQAPGTKT